MTSHDIEVWGIGTPRTLRVHWALAELALEYRTNRVQTRTAMMDEPAFLAVSPGKKIPAIRHGDLLLTESAAITRYLMDSFSPLNWTVRERALIDRFVYFSLMEIDATAFYVIRRHEGLPAIYGEAPIAVSAAYEYANRQLAVLSQLIGDQMYCVADRFSEADIHVVSVLAWGQMLDVQLPNNLLNYVENIKDRPSFQQAMLENTAN